MRVQFGEFEFDSSTAELRQGKTVVPLQPQPASVLALLLERPGQTVTRSEIQHHVWGADTHVDFEQGINWCVRRIREVLGDSLTECHYIQTVPRRGYRFVAEVKECIPPSAKNRPAVWWKYRRIAVAAGVLVLIAIWGGLAVGRAPLHRVTVLVLPFDNLSGSQTGPAYEDIASDQLMAQLALINPKRLSVIDPMTARKFKNTKECIIHIGNQLGADYVLLGDVESSATAVKVDAQLFQVSTNRQVWAAERQIPRNGEFSPIWKEMSTSISVQLQQNTVAKN